MLARALRAAAPAAPRRRRATFVLAAALAIVSVQAGVVWAGGSNTETGAQRPAAGPTSSRELAGRSIHEGRSVTLGHSYKNDVSRPLRRIPAAPLKASPEREASPNLRTGRSHRNAPDGARQTEVFAPRMPSPSLNIDGIAFPGVNCFCAPPDTNGEVGLSQYVQIVNQGLQVFNKTTGTSVLGPVDIATLWSGFGGVCENDAWGDPVVVYDQLANRWVVSQFAGFYTNGTITDECVAVSQGSDATGGYNRYGFHLGTDFFDYPKLGVWPDAYYMSMNVFNADSDTYLGPQPFALDRAAMLAGNPASFITTGITVGPSEDPYLPADLDGSTLP